MTSMLRELLKKTFSFTYDATMSLYNINSLSLVSAVHLLPLVKGRNSESSPKLPFYTVHLIVYVDHMIFSFSSA